MVVAKAFLRDNYDGAFHAFLREVSKRVQTLMQDEVIDEGVYDGFGFLGGFHDFDETAIEHDVVCPHRVICAQLQRQVI